MVFLSRDSSPQMSERDFLPDLFFVSSSDVLSAFCEGVFFDPWILCPPSLLVVGVARRCGRFGASCAEEFVRVAGERENTSHFIVL